MLDRLLPVLLAESDDSFIPAERVMYPTLASIFQQVASDYNLPEMSLRSSSRFPELISARQDFYYRAALLTLKSYPQIGRFIDRDHTTIMHGIKAHCRRHNLPHPRMKAARLMSFLQSIPRPLP